MYAIGKINEYRLVTFTDKDVHAGTLPAVKGSVMRINADRPKRVEFLCPCGCREKMALFVNVDKASGVPNWKLDLDGDRPTLSPSINRLVGCQSHYFIREGKVQWA